MTTRLETPARLLTCARCGAEFGCDLSGQCWCAEETARLPMPDGGSSGFDDCLCRNCLRDMAGKSTT
jgi:hypothetical protein